MFLFLLLLRVVVLLLVFAISVAPLSLRFPFQLQLGPLPLPQPHPRQRRRQCVSPYHPAIPSVTRIKLLALPSRREEEDTANGLAGRNGNINGGRTLLTENDTTTATLTPSPDGELISSQPFWCYWSTAYELTQAGTVGALTGLLVAVFKLSIEAVRHLCYEQDLLVPYPALIALIPALGGVVVGVLYVAGGGAFPPGLRGTVRRVMDDRNGGHPTAMDVVEGQADFARKVSAAVATLGTGASLGPEGPCVEIGLNVARACTSFNRPVPSREAGVSGNVTNQRGGRPPRGSGGNGSSNNRELQRGWNRVLLSAGAAAGVAAGFNAPIAGVFFALEIMQNTFTAIDEEAASSGRVTSSNLLQSFTSTTSITPVLLASVLSALISQSLLGDHLILTLSQFTLETPLVELPLYLLLGAMSGLVAFIFTYSAKLSKQFFSGELGNDVIKDVMSSIPDAAKPAIGGLICGVVGIIFPQILFFGYETLNSLLKDGGLPLGVIVTLLSVKIIVTAISAGSGLVGGTFAPSLFFGAMLGGAFHEGAIYSFKTMMDMLPPGSTAALASTNLHIAGVPAYAMVGAASVLAALFRAPLTASLLLFEVSRNYDVILPLMASAGIGSVVGDILEDRFEKRDEMQRRDKDPVSWGGLSDNAAAHLESQLGIPSATEYMDSTNED